MSSSSNKIHNDYDGDDDDDRTTRLKATPFSFQPSIGQRHEKFVQICKPTPSPLQRHRSSRHTRRRSQSNPNARSVPGHSGKSFSMSNLGQYIIAVEELKKRYISAKAKLMPALEQICSSFLQATDSSSDSYSGMMGGNASPCFTELDQSQSSSMNTTGCSSSSYSRRLPSMKLSGQEINILAEKLASEDLTPVPLSNIEASSMLYWLVLSWMTSSTSSWTKLSDLVSPHFSTIASPSFMSGSPGTPAKKSSPVSPKSWLSLKHLVAITQNLYRNWPVTDMELQQQCSTLYVLVSSTLAPLISYLNLDAECIAKLGDMVKHRKELVDGWFPADLESDYEERFNLYLAFLSYEQNTISGLEESSVGDNPTLDLEESLVLGKENLLVSIKGSSIEKLKTVSINVIHCAGDWLEIPFTQTALETSLLLRKNRLVTCRICEKLVPALLLEKHDIKCSTKEKRNFEWKSRFNKLFHNVAGPYINDNADFPSAQLLKEFLVKKLDLTQSEEEKEQTLAQMEWLVDNYPIVNLPDFEVPGEYDESDGTNGSSSTGGSSGPTIDDFTICKMISRGAYGRVFLTQKKVTGDYFAVKVVQKSSLMFKKKKQPSVSSPDQNDQEMLIMSKLLHQFTVNMYYSFDTGDHVFYVMEWLWGGDLYSLLRNMGGQLDRTWALQYTAEILEALNYIHGLDIVHRDLKPENIMIGNEGHIKLTDFGLSLIGLYGKKRQYVGLRYLDNWLRLLELTNNWNTENRFNACGTPDYIAPESITGTRKLTKNVDYWAMCVIHIEMITGIPPFHGETPMQIFQNILQVKYQLTESQLEPDDISFAASIFKLDVGERLGSRLGFQEISKHSLFKKYQGLWGNIWGNTEANFVPRVGKIDDLDYFVRPPQYANDSTEELRIMSPKMFGYDGTWSINDTVSGTGTGTGTGTGIGTGTGNFINNHVASPKLTGISQSGIKPLSKSLSNLMLLQDDGDDFTSHSNHSSDSKPRNSVLLFTPDGCNNSDTDSMNSGGKSFSTKTFKNVSTLQKMNKSVMSKIFSVLHKDRTQFHVNAKARRKSLVRLEDNPKDTCPNNSMQPLPMGNRDQDKGQVSLNETSMKPIEIGSSIFKPVVLNQNRSIEPVLILTGNAATSLTIQSLKGFDKTRMTIISQQEGARRVIKSFLDSQSSEQYPGTLLLDLECDVRFRRKHYILNLALWIRSLKNTCSIVFFCMGRKTAENSRSILDFCIGNQCYVHFGSLDQNDVYQVLLDTQKGIIN